MLLAPPPVSQSPDAILLLGDRQKRGRGARFEAGVAKRGCGPCLILPAKQSFAGVARRACSPTEHSRGSARAERSLASRMCNGQCREPVDEGARLRLPALGPRISGSPPLGKPGSRGSRPGELRTSLRRRWTQEIQFALLRLVKDGMSSRRGGGRGAGGRPPVSNDVALKARAGTSRAAGHPNTKGRP